MQIALLSRVRGGAANSTVVPLVLTLAAASELIWIGAFLARFPLTRYYRLDIDMGAITSHSQAAFVVFIVAFAALFILFAASLELVRRGSAHIPLSMILGIGAVFGGTLSFVYPITAVDVFTYVAQSRILLHYHENPIFVVPATYGNDPIMRLTDGWAGTGAPYGPIGILLDALPSVPVEGNLLLSLVFTKLFFSLLTLVGASLAWRILRFRRADLALTGAAFVAWNPLILFETSANGHNDVIMMVILLLALESVSAKDTIAGTVLVVASALVKYGTAILVPLVVVHALANTPGRRRYVIAAGALSAGLLIAAYLPFWEGPDTLSRSLLENTFHFESFGSVAVAFFPISIDPATTIGRLLFVPVYVYSLVTARGSFADLVRACFLTVLGFLGLATANFRIWYAVWPNFIAAISARPAARIAAIVMGFGATISATFYAYLWVWDQLKDFVVVNDMGYVATFGPPLAVLLIARLEERSRVRGHESEAGETPKAAPEPSS
ncbi:MAG TPA: hypothetical protein VFA78_00890 [Chloroflexota bacterium]|nr:hypothetical protein [Chloroflexota bacterium]